MSNFELFDFDMSNFDMSDLDMASFGHSNLDILNNGIAPDAFQWTNEEHPTAGYMPSATPATEEKSAFQADLEVIDDPSVPSASKKWMFDVLLSMLAFGPPFVLVTIDLANLILYRRCHPVSLL